MRAIWITKHGGPNVLEVRETPDPEPGPGEVRIRVRACGLNFAEVSARQGLYPDAPKPPCVVGYEGAGVIDALGEGVTDLAVGTRVLYLSRFGGHADTVCVPAPQTFALPDALSFEKAAAIPVNYLTAHLMLFRIARIRSGDRVLIHMAAGGVGTAALQLCRTVPGVTTFGTASAGKHAYVRAQGCDHPIDYRSTDYVTAVRALTDGQGVDFVFDALGGGDWRRGYELLRSTGMLVCFGMANTNTGGKARWLHVIREFLRIPRFHPFKLMEANKAVAGTNLGHLWDRLDLLVPAMREIVRLYEEGKIDPQLDSTFPFDKAAEAHGRLEFGKNQGKVVLVP